LELQVKDISLNSIQVSTKKELEEAMKDKYLEIIVKGNLGDKLHESKK